jgi:hypothetical protein
MKKCGCVSPRAKQALVHLSHEAWESEMRGNGQWIRCAHRIPDDLMAELVKNHYLDTKDRGAVCRLRQGAYDKLLEWERLGMI